MKIGVVPREKKDRMMFGEQDYADGPFAIIVTFPMEYMEIKQERVSIPSIG